MARHSYRVAVAGACALATAGACLFGGGSLPSDGFFFDIAARLATGWAAPSTPDQESRVALVLLDDRSLAAEEFAPVPRTFLGPYWADLLDALDAAGVTAVGFDVIFEYTPNLFRADFDQTFLRALNQHKDKLVLGRSAQTTVALPYHYALGAEANEGVLSLVEMEPDDDGVFRRIQGFYRDEEGTRHPTLINTLLARSGYGPMPDAVLAAPWGPLELTLPAYSMIDVLRCAEQPEVLAKAFAGKMVLVGSALPEEDRKPAADRWFPIPEGSTANRLKPDEEGCKLGQAGVSNPPSGTVPGVYVHALAADAVARGRVVREASAMVSAGVSAVLALLGAAFGFLLSPWSAALAWMGSAASLFVGDTLALGLRHGWLGPSFAFGGSLMSVGIAYAARYMFEDRRRRQVQHAFSHYLSPVIVERLAAGAAELKLGGEARDVTVMFADLSGFTALSTRVGPAELMEVTNRYLGYIVEEVEATGGYVDKFIGDAVMAMWGAPAPNSDHPGDAVSAALAAAERVVRMRDADRQHGTEGFSVKIGLCSGPAIVGNVGTAKRFNYTAVGETVNIASRMEGLPGTYGCRVVVAEETARRVAGRFLLCELDRVRVKGRSTPLTIFEPLCRMELASAAMRDYIARYGSALAAYRARDFAAAQAEWLQLRHPLDSEAAPSPAALMAKRAADYLAHPPPADWDGVFTAPKG